MSTLWFVVPAYGRVALSRVCLRQLRRSCESLAQNGIHASAVVIADDENLDTAADLGFATVERDNRSVSARFNDGIQLACDPAFNARPADYVVPCGSDDWVDSRLFLELPAEGEMHGFQNISYVSEDGSDLVATTTPARGGCGIRIYPRQLMEAVDYRPADEDRSSYCDTSILMGLLAAHGNNMSIVHRRSDPRQIVDWKTDGQQLHSFSKVTRSGGQLLGDPFFVLADVFPLEARAEMTSYHRSRDLVAA